MRSDGDLRVGTNWTIQRDADGSGFADRFAVQHVSTCGAAAGADWESGRRVTERSGEPDQDSVFVFCGEHAGGTFFCGVAGRAQSQRDEIPATVEEPGWGECTGGSHQRAGQRSAGGADYAEPERRPWCCKSRRGPMSDSQATKKELILQTAQEIGAQQHTP